MPCTAYVFVQVLRGYFGDRSAKPVFSSGPSSSSGGQGDGNLFDVLGTGYQRPFERATVRLFNMQTVLTNCEWRGRKGGVAEVLAGGCNAGGGACRVGLAKRMLALHPC